MDVSHYSVLAKVFDYPGPDFIPAVQKACQLLDIINPAALADLQAFARALPEAVAEQGELFTRTFEVQGMTTLDVGYILFGDDYKRAELLSNLAREHLDHGVDCGSELADNLPNILRLLAQLDQGELRSELVSEILIPGLLLMLRDFEPERIEKKNENYRKHYKSLLEVPAGLTDALAYRLPLQALLHVLVQDFQMHDLVQRLQQWVENPKTADFLGFIGREVEIEDLANPVNSGKDS